MKKCYCLSLGSSVCGLGRPRPGSGALALCVIKYHLIVLQPLWHRDPYFQLTVEADTEAGADGLMVRNWTLSPCLSLLLLTGGNVWYHCLCLNGRCWAHSGCTSGSDRPSGEGLACVLSHVQVWRVSQPEGEAGDLRAVLSPNPEDFLLREVGLFISAGGACCCCWW